ncbi:MAG: hypothetical protein C4536_03325 [Actinobacteria bacterium]|jgi:hypothetical protein|nr:MAG: hypothetical protein C4536_03325 [Actinomycetota bacterium]
MLVEIGGGEITLQHMKSGDRISRQIDNVVLAVGAKEDKRLAGELEQVFTRVRTVGDAHRVGRIHNAVRDAFDTAWEL